MFLSITLSVDMTREGTNLEQRERQSGERTKTSRTYRKICSLNDVDSGCYFSAQIDASQREVFSFQRGQPGLRSTEIHFLL